MTSSVRTQRSPLSKFGTLILMLLAIALPILGLLRRPTHPEVEATPTAASLSPTPTDEKIRVVALGRLEPASGVLQVGVPINEIIGQLKVEEGDWVNQGEILAYLKSHPERRIELEQAQQNLLNAQQRLKAETEFSQAQVRERKVDITQAPLTQEREISAQEALIGELKSEMNLAESELRRYQALVSEGAVPRRDLETRQAQVDQLNQRIKQAQETLKKFISVRDRELANIQAQVQTAQSNTDRIRANSEVQSAQEAIKVAQVRLDNTVIKSPKSGRILRVITKAGETVGDNGRGQGILVQLANTQTMQVVAEVNEADISQVEQGQRASIISRNQAFSGKLSGTVSSIGQQIFKNNVLNDDPSALSDARVIEVKVAVDNSNDIAKLTNLQVEVQIEVKPSKNPT